MLTGDHHYQRIAGHHPVEHNFCRRHLYHQLSEIVHVHCVIKKMKDQRKDEDYMLSTFRSRLTEASCAHANRIRGLNWN